MSTTDEVFGYVMNSPEDTNPAVLKSLLEGIETGDPTDVIDDTAAASDKTYSSSKVEDVASKVLPTVTSLDNGMVLGVSSGAWAKMSPPSGNDVFLISLENRNGTFTADKTYNEILAAVESGKAVYVNLYIQSIDESYHYIPFGGEESESGNLYFNYFQPYGNSDTSGWLYIGLCARSSGWFMDMWTAPEV